MVGGHAATFERYFCTWLKGLQLKSSFKTSVIQSRSESYNNIYIYIYNCVICVSHPGVKETKCSSCLVGKVTSTSW